MPFHFDKHAQKGNSFLKELAAQLGDPADLNRAGRIMRCVFHVLRDHLSMEESFQLLSQLPMALKAVYVDAWIPQKQKKKSSRTIADFINEVISADGLAAERDFQNADDALDGVYAVFIALRKHVSDGELRHMQAVLPPDMKALLQSPEANQDIVIEIISDL